MIIYDRKKVDEITRKMTVVRYTSNYAPRPYSAVNAVPVITRNLIENSIAEHNRKHPMFVSIDRLMDNDPRWKR